MNDGQVDILICGERLKPDPIGALYWRERETLIVSDLHFEKGSSFAPSGQFLPPYDTRMTLSRLEKMRKRYRPKRIISLGDAFHDGEAEARMELEDAERLALLMKDVDWLWILGNHDPAPSRRFNAATAEEKIIGPLTFRHEPLLADSEGEIAGHLHPCARVIAEGRIQRRRCFASSGTRIVMPALGAYTGGLNVLDEAFESIFCAPGESMTAWVMGEKGVYPVPTERLAPDVLRTKVAGE